MEQRLGKNGPQSFKKTLIYICGFSSGSDGEEFSCNAGDPGLIPGSERSPGEGNGNPLQYSCLENSTDRETWWDTVHGGHKESDTTELSHTMRTYYMAQGTLLSALW